MSEWISVKERQPEPNTEVTVYSSEIAATDAFLQGIIKFTPGVRRGYYLAGILQKWRVIGVNGVCEVTHWMPLPDPPKE